MYVNCIPRGALLRPCKTVKLRLNDSRKSNSKTDDRPSPNNARRNHFLAFPDVSGTTVSWSEKWLRFLIYSFFWSVRSRRNSLKKLLQNCSKNLKYFCKFPLGFPKVVRILLPEILSQNVGFSQFAEKGQGFLNFERFWGFFLDYRQLAFSTCFFMLEPFWCFQDYSRAVWVVRLQVCLIYRCLNRYLITYEGGPIST